MTTRGAHVAMLTLAAAAVAGLMAPTRVRAAGTLIPRSVMSAGATIALGPNVRLVGTVGQLAVGKSITSALAAIHGFWSFAAPPVLAVDTTGWARQLPATVEFGAPMPNPSQTSIAFDLGLPRAAQVALRILDLQGRSIAVPATRSLAAGRHRLVFTPVGEAPLGPGVYFARLLVDGHVAGTQRFVRIR